MKLRKGKVTVEVKDNDPNKVLKISGFKRMGFAEVGKKSDKEETKTE